MEEEVKNDSSELHKREEFTISHNQTKEKKRTRDSQSDPTK